MEAHFFTLCLKIMTWYDALIFAGAFTEAEVRFAIVDSIVKRIVQCTDTFISAEATMSADDNETGLPSMSRTPSKQKSVSRNVQTDYSMYSLTADSSSPPVCVIIEVKTKKSFNDNAVCQVIGYRLARKGAAGTHNVIFKLHCTLYLPIFTY